MPLTAEQEWNKELTRILRVHQRAAGRDPQAVDSGQVAIVNARYGEMATGLRTREQELVGLRLAKLNAASPSAEELEPQAVNRRLSDLKRALKQPKLREAIGIERAKQLDKLLEQAETKARGGHHAQVHEILNTVDSEVSVRYALQRDDLQKLIARNDTWGKFDLVKATNGSSVEDERILQNVLDSAWEAQQADEDWRQYQSAVAKLAKSANAPSPSTPSPSTPSPSTPSPSTPSPSTPTPAPSTGYDRSRGLAAVASPETVYKLAILGAGASAAYYLANANVDLQTTVIIGQKDPWAGERGGEPDAVINHPHNMIDPEGRPEFEGGLAKRSKFAEKVAAVIDRAPHQCDGWITKIKKEKVKQGEKQYAYYRIETNQGVYFAQRVVSALGIGEHMDRLDVKGTELENDVRDMDAFMRDLPGFEAKGDEYVIGVSGGNAAIDVVTAILRSKSKARIHWFRGSNDPMFLDGTDNDVARKEYNDGKGTARLTVHKTRVSSVAKQASGKVLVNGRQEVDEVVYGLGPNVSAVAKLFDPSCHEVGDGDEMLDRNQHFDLGLFAEDPQRNPADGKDPDVVIKQLKLTDPSYATTLLEFLNDPSLKNEDLVARLSRGNPPTRTATGTQPPPQASDVQFIGGQHARSESRDRDGNATDDLARFNDQVNATLPANVVVGDQLTPSRARVEASEEAMPFSADDFPLVMEEGGVNFITSNQTVIATHIAACYPNIPAGLANYLTAQIIVARNKQTRPLPRRPVEGQDHTLQDQEEFQTRWVGRLREINRHLVADPPLI
jgi:hypothetical protein